MTFDSARVIIEVHAGVLPGVPDPAHTRRFGLSANQWREAGDEQMQLLAQTVADAQTYATTLMMRPHELNWVRAEWTWL